MPSKWYRAKLRNSNQQISFNNPIRQISVLSENGRLKIKEIQTAIFDIIQSIILQVEINTVFTVAKDLLKFVKTRKDVLELLEKIKNLITQNFLSSSDQGIVNTILQKLQSLKSDIEQHDASCCIDYLSDNFTNNLTLVLKMIADLIDINSIKSNVEIIYEKLHKSVMSEEYIRQAEETLLSIFQNLADRVDFSIIRTRIIYIQELILKVDKDCIFYDAVISREITDIICAITNTTSYDFVNEMDRIRIRIQALYNQLYNKMECIKILKQSEELLFSIIGNIVDRVDLHIVAQRLTYLQEILRIVEAG